MTESSAPRRFSSPPTALELERLAEAVERLYQEIRFGVALRPRLGIVRAGSVTLGYNEIVRIDTDSGNTIAARLPDVRRSGLCGLIRMSGAGAVDVYPQPGRFVDNLSVYSVSTDVGAWLFYSDGVAWYSVR